MIRYLLPMLALVLAPVAAPLAADAETPLIPRNALFGNPEKAQARISPDGRHLSWIAPRDGVLNVWVAPAGDVGAARPITNDRKRGIRQHFWMPSGTHVLYLQDEGGDENWRLHGVDIATGNDRDLTPLPGVQAQIIGISPERPGTVLVGLNDLLADWGIPGEYDHPRVREAYAATIATCRKRRKHCGVGGLATRPDLVAEFVRMGARYVSTGTDLGFLMGALTARAKAVREIEL